MFAYVTVCVYVHECVCSLREDQLVNNKTSVYASIIIFIAGLMNTSLGTSTNLVNTIVFNC